MSIGDWVQYLPSFWNRGREYFTEFLKIFPLERSLGQIWNLFEDTGRVFKLLFVLCDLLPASSLSERTMGLMLEREAGQ